MQDADDSDSYKSCDEEIEESTFVQRNVEEEEDDMDNM